MAGSPLSLDPPSRVLALQAPGITAFCQAEGACQLGRAPAPFLARRPLTGPLEMALGWGRALGTAAGFAMVGFLVHAKYPAAQMPLASPPL